MDNKIVYRGDNYHRASGIYEKHYLLLMQLPQEERFNKSPVTLLKVK